MIIRRSYDNEVHVQQLGGEVRKVNHIHSPISSSLTSEATPARRWDPGIQKVVGTARRDGSIETEVRIRITDQHGSRADARREAKQDGRRGKRGGTKKTILSLTFFNVRLFHAERSSPHLTCSRQTSSKDLTSLDAAGSSSGDRSMSGEDRLVNIR